MTSRDFAFWLQGYFEISDTNQLSENQVQMIKNHLNLVFIHEIDPSMGDKKHQQVLNEVHQPKPTLEELGKQHGFSVTTGSDKNWGPSPGEGYKLGIHGWYDPKQGTPRC